MREWILFHRAQKTILYRQWQHTSALLAQTYNMNAKPGQGKSPDDFNPLHEKLVENQGIETKEDVMKLVERLTN